jgi:transposase InsO family protein
VARLEPKKKPRSAWRRFVYPAPNACWQLDATGYVLTGGRTCVILQLIDDHSRYAVASYVAGSETADAAIAVFDKAVAALGVPQRLLSDNGIALNPSRRGFLGQLVEHVGRLGVEAITGKPYQPTPRERTNASTRGCPDIWTSSHWLAPWPSCRPRSTPSTTSTTPNAPTSGSLDASHR